MSKEQVFPEEIESKARNAIYNYGHSKQSSLNPLDFKPEKVFHGLIIPRAIDFLRNKANEDQKAIVYCGISISGLSDLYTTHKENGKTLYEIAHIIRDQQLEKNGEGKIKKSYIENCFRSFAENLNNPTSTPYELIAPYNGKKTLDDKKTGPIEYELDTDNSPRYYRFICYSLIKLGENAFIGKCEHPPELPKDKKADIKGGYGLDTRQFATKSDKKQEVIKQYAIPVIVPFEPEKGRDYLEWFVHVCRVFENEKEKLKTEEIKGWKYVIDSLSEKIYLDFEEIIQKENKTDQEENALGEFEKNVGIIKHYATKNNCIGFFDRIIESSGIGNKITKDKIDNEKKDEYKNEKHPEHIIDIALRAHTLTGQELDAQEIREYINNKVKLISDKIKILYELNPKINGATMARIIGTDPVLIYRDKHYHRKKKGK